MKNTLPATPREAAHTTLTCVLEPLLKNAATELLAAYGRDAPEAELDAIMHTASPLLRATKAVRGSSLPTAEALALLPPEARRI